MLKSKLVPLKLADSQSCLCDQASIKPPEDNSGPFSDSFHVGTEGFHVPSCEALHPTRTGAPVSLHVAVDEASVLNGV